MSSDAVLSYVGKLLGLLSLVVLFSVGYSAYSLLPSLYGQTPKTEFNGTHIIIEGINLRNEGLYTLKLDLNASAGGQVYSSSLTLKPGQSGELKLAVPAVENASIALYFEMVPFIKAKIELPSLSAQPGIVLKGLDVRRVNGYYEISISYCLNLPVELSLKFSLVKDGNIIDSVTKSYPPGTVCDTLTLKAPPGSYMLQVSYASFTYSVPVVLP